MTKRIRFPFDRRCGEDRRSITNRGYFRLGGDERRIRGERRSGKERRKDWLRVTKWSSVWADLLDIKKRFRKR